MTTTNSALNMSLTNRGRNNFVLREGFIWWMHRQRVDCAGQTCTLRLAPFFGSPWLPCFGRRQRTEVSVVIQAPHILCNTTTAGQPSGANPRHTHPPGSIITPDLLIQILISTRTNNQTATNNQECTTNSCWQWARNIIISSTRAERPITW